MDNTSPPDPSMLTETYKFKLVIDIMLLLLDFGLVWFLIILVRDLKDNKVKQIMAAVLLLCIFEFTVYLGFAFAMDSHYPAATLSTIAANKANPFALDDIMTAAAKQVAKLSSFVNTSVSTAGIPPDINNLVASLQGNMTKVDIDMLNWQAQRSMAMNGVIAIITSFAILAGVGIKWRKYSNPPEGEQRGNWWVPVIITCVALLLIPRMIYPFANDIKQKSKTQIRDSIKLFKELHVAGIPDLDMGLKSLLAHVPGINLPVAQFTGVIVTGVFIFCAGLAAAIYVTFGMVAYPFAPWMLGPLLAILAVAIVILVLSIYYMRLVGNVEVIGAETTKTPTVKGKVK